MTKSLNSILTFVFVISITNSCFGQELSIYKEVVYKCHQDSTWHGICAELDFYEYEIRNNRIKPLRKKEINKGHQYTKSKFVLSDSTYLEKRFNSPKKASYELFNKLLHYIFINQEDKLIGMDVKYFSTKEYRNTHTYTEIQDSLCNTKKAISLRLSEIDCSDFSRILTVKTTFNGEKYSIWRNLNEMYWFVQKKDSDEPAFKFFYPDWNIMINNLMQTPKSVKNELQIIRLNNEQNFDIGRKILIPHKKRKKKHLLEKPSVETTITKLHFFYPKLKS